MRYVPKPQPAGIADNANVSKRHPLAELAILLIGAFLLVLAIYGLLGLAVDMAARYLPVEYEMSLSGLGDEMFPQAAQDDARTKYLSGILDRLLSGTEPDGRSYRIDVLDYAEGDTRPANALALPGGRIVVFCGLLEQARSENELAMVLGHELGHFRNRDHLRSLGRGLVVTGISVLLLGENSGVSRFLMGSMSIANLNYTQLQETEADRFGLDLLHHSYGHVGGATDFFSRMATDEPHPALNALFSTHPLSSRRVKALEGMTRDRGFATGALTALPEGMQCKLES